MPSGTSTTPIPPPVAKSSKRAGTWFGAFWQKRVCVVPTWRGWVVLLLVISGLLVFGFRHLGTFLTVNDPVPGGVLVIEGWVPPYVAHETLDEFHRHSYVGIWVTGGPIEEENPYFGYQTYANLTATKLREMGAPESIVHGVPAPFVDRDRTYASAVTLKKELESHGISTEKINVVSVGPHSRRSRLLYEMAFGSHSQIGMVGINPRDYDVEHWWTTSAGFRTVVSEFIAYGYARVIFRP